MLLLSYQYMGSLKNPNMTGLKRKSGADNYAALAWRRTAVLVESEYPENGDLTLAQWLKLFSWGDSPGRAARWEASRGIMDSPDFPACLSLRQLRRLAAKGKIPGAYCLKGGHYRVRRCQKLYRWLAAGGILPKPTLSEKKLRARDRNIAKKVALATRSGLNGAFEKNPDPLWRMSLRRLPRKYLEPASKKKELDVALAMGELSAKGKKITPNTVARELGISRATFFRKYYNRILNELKKQFIDDSAIIEKDWRAENLDKGQALQETRDRRPKNGD